jgi:kinesin family member C2/C3
LKLTCLTHNYSELFLFFSKFFRGVNPAKKASPLQKKLNGPSPTPIKKIVVDAKRTNGKPSARK